MFDNANWTLLLSQMINIYLGIWDLMLSNIR